MGPLLLPLLRIHQRRHRLRRAPPSLQTHTTRRQSTGPALSAPSLYMRDTPLLYCVLALDLIYFSYMNQANFDCPICFCMLGLTPNNGFVSSAAF